MIKESMVFMYFNRSCGAALAFYQEAFGATILEKTSYGEAEMTDKEEEKPLIMNATFHVGNMKFCANDVLDVAPVVGNNVCLWLELDDEVSLDKVFEAFKRPDCQIVTPLEDTFWNGRYAKVQDPFGMLWELNYQR